MSSDSEICESIDSVESTDESQDSEEDWGVIETEIIPYQDEPLADAVDEETMAVDGESDEEKDVDGLTPAVLEQRYERTVTLDSWCRCHRCNTETLVGSLEFRCCREVTNASGKMVFDGSIERISCITEHDDYDAITNRAVLVQVAPLLRDKDGRTYRRRAGVSENEFIRAVAYRWTTRWLCGYMGWDNTRPLPACVYHNIRTKYQSRQSRGYASAQEREN